MWISAVGAKRLYFKVCSLFICFEDEWYYLGESSILVIPAGSENLPILPPCTRIAVDVAISVEENGEIHRAAEKIW